MYIQWFVKGIASVDALGNPVLDKDRAFEMIRGGHGIIANWWRKQGTISPSEVQDQLTAYNLDRHVHDYTAFGADSPFISLASGSVERDLSEGRNHIYSAVDTALDFATRTFSCAGALFMGWVPVALNPAVEIAGVAQAIRDLNVYRRWSPYQLEGEITAKVSIPANQIAEVEWWDPAIDTSGPRERFTNIGFVSPAPVLNQREYF